MQEGLVASMSMAMPEGLAKLPRVEEASQHRDFGDRDISDDEGYQQKEKRCMTDSHLQGVHGLTSLRSARSSPR